MARVHGSTSIAFLVVVLPLLLNLVRAQTAVPVPAGSDNFDHAAPYSYTINVARDSNNLPRVSSDFASTAAARTGSYGLSVNVGAIDPTRPGYQAELITSRIALNASHVYTWTFYARATAAISTTIAMLQAGSYQPAQVTGISLTQAWKYFSIATATPLPYDPNNPDTAYHYFQVQLGGTANVQYQFDTFQVTSDYLDQSWAQPASINSRIQSLRTTQLFLNITNAQGVPLSTVDQIQFTMTKHAFPFGAAMAIEYHPNDNWYTSTAASLFPGAATPENAFKWPFYEPTQGNTAAGAATTQNLRDNYVNANDISLFRGHTLEWGEAYVSCVFQGTCHWSLARRSDGTFNCTQYRLNVLGRIQRDVTQWADNGGPDGGFGQFDVWNEVLHAPGLLDVCGWGLLDEAFKAARQASPTARLCMNDYGLIEGDDWVRMVELVSGMLSRGVPVNCIAIEQHLTVQDIDPVLMAIRINRLSRVGLPLIISEFSLNTGWPPTGSPSLQLSEQQQSIETLKLVSRWYAHPSIIGIVFWCFWDDQCFVQGGGFFYANHTAKAVANDLDNLLYNTWSTTYSGDAGTNGAHNFATSAASFRGFIGTYDLRFRYQGTTYATKVPYRTNRTPAGAPQTAISSAIVRLDQCTPVPAAG